MSIAALPIIGQKAGPAKTLNLIYVHQPRKLWASDMEAIADKIAVIAPEIKVMFVLQEHTADVIPAADWARPSLTFSFGNSGRFIPMRGPLYENRVVSKLDQFRAFRRLGIPTPNTAPYQDGMELDPAHWGPFVILKPADPHATSNGLHLQVFRTSELSGRLLPQDHPSRRMRMLVQQWIDTGEKLTTYRCLTLFGAVLYGSRSQREEARPPLDSPNEVIEAMPAEADRGNNSRTHDPALMAFGSRMAEAFPRHPVLGCDMVQEEGTGVFYALEVNAGGNVWHFSSPRTAKSRTYEKTRSLIEEFSSFDTAAKVLVKKTRAEAR
jgi:hypothetical protein